MTTPELVYTLSDTLTDKYKIDLTQDQLRCELVMLGLTSLDIGLNGNLSIEDLIAKITAQYTNEWDSVTITSSPALAKIVPTYKAVAHITESDTEYMYSGDIPTSYFHPYGYAHGFNAVQ